MRSVTLHKTPILITILAVVLMMLSSCSSSQDPKKLLIGKWIRSVGPVTGFGDVETLEFSDNGTVTSRTKNGNFVGDYRFLDDDTIRIEWHSSKQTFDVYPEEYVLVMINIADESARLYYNMNKMQIKGTPMSVSYKEIPRKAILGKWALACSEEKAKSAGVFVEFKDNGFVSFAVSGTSTYVMQDNFIKLENGSSLRVLYVSGKRLIFTGDDQRNGLVVCLYKL